jgi:hypothetical protein
MIVIKAHILRIAVFATGTTSSPARDTSSACSARAIISCSAVVVDFTCCGGVLCAETAVARPSGRTIRVGSTDVVVVKTDILRVAVLAGSTGSSRSAGDSGCTGIVEAV